MIDPPKPYKAATRTTLSTTTKFDYMAALGVVAVVAGDVIETRAEGFRYEVALPEALDHDEELATGVKLYVLPDAGGEWNARAFNAPIGGTLNAAPAVQRMMNKIEAKGGIAIVPRGKYLFEQSVTLDRTYAVDPAGGSIGERSCLVLGFGAEIVTDNPIYAFTLRGGWRPNMHSHVQGFTINHRGNTEALGGFLLEGVGVATISDNTIVVAGSLPTGYKAIHVRNADGTDSDTGSFWCVIERNTIGVWAGADGNCDFGVYLEGAANNTRVLGNRFGGCNTHVKLAPHAGRSYAPNAVEISGNAFEGPVTATAIELNNTGVNYHVTGTRILNNRFEALATAVKLTGTGTTVQIPTFMMGNYADTSVTTYISNPLNIPMTVIDPVIVGAPMPPITFHNQKGVYIKNDDGAKDALTLGISALGRGLRFQRGSDNLELGRLVNENQAGGTGMVLRGQHAGDYRPLGLAGVKGISQTDQTANNFLGSVNFANQSSKLVTFAYGEEADAGYYIFLSAPVSQKFWTTAKTKSGFTLNCDAAITANVGWMLVRGP